MGICIIKTETDPQTGAVQSMDIEQRSSRGSCALFLLVLVPAMTAMLLPVGVFLGLLLTDPGARAVLVDRSSSALLVALGLGIWATLWGVPAWRFVRQLGARRVVHISSSEVCVIDHTLFGHRAWSCPLGAFLGLSHKVATTVSGASHELVLMHRDRAKCVLVKSSPLISETQTIEMARLLGQRVVSMSPNAGSTVSIPAVSRENTGNDALPVAA